MKVSLIAFILLAFFYTPVWAQSKKGKLDQVSVLIEEQKFDDAYWILTDYTSGKNSYADALMAKLIDRGTYYNWNTSLPRVPNYYSAAEKASEFEKVTARWEHDMQYYTESALKRDDKNALAYEMRAVLYAFKKDKVKAEDDLEKSRLLDPKNCHTDFTAGRLYITLGEYAKAEEVLDNYVNCSPKDMSGRRLRSIAKAKLKKYEEAVADVKMSIQVDSNTKASYLSAGYTYTNIGEESHDPGMFNAAKEIYRKALEKWKGDKDFEKNLQMIYSYEATLYDEPTRQLIKYVLANDAEKAIPLLPKATLSCTFSDEKNYTRQSTLVLTAGMNGNIELVKQLLKAGASPDIQNENGGTLFHAIYSRSVGQVIPAILKSLIAYKAAINLQDNRGQTPLFYAARYGHLPVVEELLRNGADPNLADKDGDVPLLWADGWKVYKMLIDNGANINVVNSRKGTPLNRAFQNWPFSMPEIYLLLKSGVNIGPYDKAPDPWITGFMELIKNEVIGSPAEKLFDKLIDQDAAGFLAALKLQEKQLSPELIKALSMSSAYLEAKAPFEYLATISPKGANQVYDYRSQTYVRPIDIAYPKKVSLTDDDKFMMYYAMEMADVKQAMDEVEKYGDHMAYLAEHPKITNLGAECPAITFMYNRTMKIYDIYQKIRVNHTDGTYVLTEQQLITTLDVISKVKKKMLFIRKKMEEWKCSVERLRPLPKD